MQDRVMCWFIVVFVEVVLLMFGIDGFEYVEGCFVFDDEDGGYFCCGYWYVYVWLINGDIIIDIIVM